MVMVMVMVMVMFCRADGEEIDLGGDCLQLGLEEIHHVFWILQRDYVVADLRAEADHQSTEVG